MTYITDHFNVPAGDRRVIAATEAKSILGNAADVYDVVTLAEFLLGDATPPPAADAEVTPFTFHARDAEGVSASVHGHDNDGDDDYAVTVMVTNGTVAGLTYYEARDLRDKLIGLLG